MFKIRLNIATTFYAWNTDIFQRTPAAMLTGGGHRYLPALIYPMHLRGALFHNVTQPRSDFHTNPMTDLAIEESAVGYIDGIHLFKAHGLSGKLHRTTVWACPASGPRRTSTAVCSAASGRPAGLSCGSC